MNGMCEILGQCRGCGGKQLLKVLDLGQTPLANALLKEEQLSAAEERFPLEVVFCADCSLLQITASVSPEKLFGEYLYFSSFSNAMLKHAESAVANVMKRKKLGSQSLAAEMASNDGYLLQYYRKAGIPVLGIEPARNIAEVARKKGVTTECRFFGLELAEELAARGQRADVIHANNVMAHVPDINGVIEGMSIFLKEDGMAIIETPYVRDLVENIEFDTIYHEHLFYYSATAMANLFGRHGMVIHDIEHLPIHGGSLRIFAVRKGHSSPTPEVEEFLVQERSLGMADIKYYKDFGAKVEELKGSLLRRLKELKAGGSSIAAYGASAKGSTLLNYFGIGKDMLDFVVDRSTYKQGLFTPGTHLPILPTEALMEKKPQYVLLLTWNFAQEILAQQAAYRQSGGKFIIPIPRVEIV
jgi:hypothetical protein